VGQLEHFTQSLADGVIDANELATQEANLVTAMKAVEGSLNDEQHTKVTRLLAEVTAYSVMRTLHEMAVRVQAAVAQKMPKEMRGVRHRPPIGTLIPRPRRIRSPAIVNVLVDRHPNAVFYPITCSATVQ
jgi:hypothetical protein